MSSCLAFFFFSIVLLSIPPLTKCKGFSTELIPWDSPKSPFYNPTLSPSERFSASISRTIARYSTLTENSTMIGDGGAEYLMSLKIGFPDQFRIMASADTGSDLTWVQCKPCDSCYRQDAPIFDPSSSPSYNARNCTSGDCSLIDGKCDKTAKCQYTLGYGDGSQSIGVLSEDYITIGDSDLSERNLFGCSHTSNGIFSSSTAGIVGLGGGNLSLVNQFFFNGGIQTYKFSYCLASPMLRSRSVIYFGENPNLSKNRITIPLVKGISPTFYTLKLVSVGLAGGKKIPVSTGAGVDDSGQGADTIVDSGTTFTYVYDGVLIQLVSQLEFAMANYRRVPDPDGRFPVCFYVWPSWLTPSIPDITFQFAGGTLTLPQANTFVQILPNVHCLAFLSVNKVKAGSSVQILGNIAQRDFQVEYNLENRTVSFAPGGCSNF